MKLITTQVSHCHWHSIRSDQRRYSLRSKIGNAGHFRQKETFFKKQNKTKQDSKPICAAIIFPNKSQGHFECRRRRAPLTVAGTFDFGAIFTVASAQQQDFQNYTVYSC